VKLSRNGFHYGNLHPTRFSTNTFIINLVFMGGLGFLVSVSGGLGHPRTTVIPIHEEAQISKDKCSRGFMSPKIFAPPHPVYLSRVAHIRLHPLAHSRARWKSQLGLLSGSAHRLPRSLPTEFLNTRRVSHYPPGINQRLSRFGTRWACQ